MPEVIAPGSGPTSGPVVPLLPKDTDTSRDRSPARGSSFLSTQHPAALALKARADDEAVHVQEWAEKVKNLQAAMTVIQNVPSTEAMQEELRFRLAQDKRALTFCQGRKEAYDHAYRIVTQGYRDGSPQEAGA